LKLSGVAVTAGQSILVASIGNLVYAPAANASGASYSSLGFKVQDNGGLANGGVDISAAATLTINVTSVNDAPTLVTLIPDQTAVMGSAFSYTMPANTFADIDGTLTYSATRGDGSALPAWMTFNATTRAFTGTPNSTTDFNVKVTASDGVASISDTFLLGIAPVVNNVAITSATGIQNGTLNAGDVVTVSATFSELVNVTGAPHLALNIGGTAVQANYVSGSGSNVLTFNYTILSSQNDANGISIDANALSLNAGTIKDAVGNSAILATASVTDNASYAVDNSVPILMGSNPGDNGYLMGVGNNLIFNFNESVVKGTGT
jgi:hypothetical protein